MICNRKEKMNLFRAAIVAVSVLLLIACADEESVAPVERENPALRDREVFTQAKSAKEYLNPDLEYGEMTDPRDGQVYKTIKIGNLVWMAENLNFSVSKLVPNIRGASWCYDNEPDYCKVGGRLYTWTAAMDLSEEYLVTNSYSSYIDRDKELSRIKRGICPEGWSIPTGEELWSIRTAFPNEDSMSVVLRSAKGWRGNAKGTNSSGFTALPVGLYSQGISFNVGFETGFWSASEYMKTEAYALKISYDETEAVVETLDKRLGLSVRCVQDTAYARVIGYDIEDRAEALKKAGNLYDTAKVVKGTLVDQRDKRKYSTIKIGDQNWMAENLNYKASDSVSTCYAHEASFCVTYGRLYTYEYARDSACPAGWHLPTRTEYKVLIERIGDGDPYYAAGLVLKSSEYWEPYQSGSVYKHDANGLDLYGFRALPGGAGILGAEADSFYNRGSEAHFWVNEGEGRSADVFYMEDRRLSTSFSWNFYTLASVRCVEGEKASFFYCPEDTTEYEKATFRGVDSSQVQDGYMKDLRDGKYYRIVTIGKQTWMAENLNGEYGRFNVVNACYMDANNYCDSLGVFYGWHDAMDLDGKYTPAEDYYCRHNEVRRGACPLGWHVPSEADWQELIETVGGPVAANIMLKSKDTWKKENGLDTYGFNVHASGLTPRDKFATQKGEKAFFWARDDITNSTGRAVVFSGEKGAAVQVIDTVKSTQMSVRCIKDVALLSEAVELQEPVTSIASYADSLQSGKDD